MSDLEKLERYYDLTSGFTQFPPKLHLNDFEQILTILDKLDHTELYEQWFSLVKECLSNRVDGLNDEMQSFLLQKLLLRRLEYLKSRVLVHYGEEEFYINEELKHTISLFLELGNDSKSFQNYLIQIIDAFDVWLERVYELNEDPYSSFKYAIDSLKFYRSLRKILYTEQKQNLNSFILISLIKVENILERHGFSNPPMYESELVQEWERLAIELDENNPQVYLDIYSYVYYNNNQEGEYWLIKAIDCTLDEKEKLNLQLRYVRELEEIADYLEGFHDDLEHERMDLLQKGYNYLKNILKEKPENQLVLDHKSKLFKKVIR